MSVFKFSFVLILFLVLGFQFFVSATLAEVGQDEAASALTEADAAVVSAYQMVLKAEEAGANVSGLLIRLNEAGEFLASANIEYRQGDFEMATDFASLCKSIAEQAQNDAVELKGSTVSEGLQRMVFTMIASIVGVALIALGSLWVWHLLKKHYGTSGFPKVD